MPSNDTTSAVNSYVTDMLSLESHIEKAVRSQLQDLKDYPEFTTLLRDFHRKIEHHISDLKELSDRRNASGATETIKRAGAAVAGVAAGIIDMIRTEGLPKNLRDDYTAFNLASIGYLMLYTTALSVGEHEVASLARQHYTDYAGVVMRLHQMVPASVVQYLQSEGLPARADVLPDINRTAEQVWENQSRSGTPGMGAGTTNTLGGGFTTRNV
jgi:ferritin-like metal-binding protein YciE